ncbi:MAG: hypothetical protein JST31_01395 [Actinobacteria bacterium]|nr:hypothetical protein [Actinomycetota bacterium]
MSEATSTEPFRSEQHWVSPFNFEPTLVASYAFPEPLRIYDSTLRKILLTPGISPPIDDLLTIADALDAVGVAAMALNIHWWGDPNPNKREFELCKALLEADFGFDISVYAQAAGPDPANVITPQEAIDQVTELGVRTLEVPFQARLDPAGLETYMAELRQTVSYAQSVGLEVVCGFGDVARSPFEPVVALANEAIGLGCTRINLMDSYSSLSVDGMKLFCREFRRRLDTPVDVTMHVHNDFGQASALAITAATAGVHPDVSVNGLSYRSGLASLQEVAVALELLYGVDTGIRLEGLQGVADLVSRCTGLPPNPLRPLTGEHQFLRDDPEAMLDYLRDGEAAFPVSSSCISPSVIGGQMSIVWGDRHATSTIRAKLSQLGIAFSDEDVANIYNAIEREVDARSEFPRWVTEVEVEQICRTLTAHQET